MASQTRIQRKRRGDDSLEFDQRLSKRFNLLNIEHSAKLWSPAGTDHPPKPLGNPTTIDAGARDSMHVDETRDRVFVHNLDEEIASIEAQESEDRLVFLPDIEKKLKKLTGQLITGGEVAPHQQQLGTELVLYQVPSSLSLPPEQDSVRKAILESRARARESQQQASRDAQLHDVDETGDAFGSMGATLAPEEGDERYQDDDAMDIG